MAVTAKTASLLRHMNIQWCISFGWKWEHPVFVSWVSSVIPIRIIGEGMGMEKGCTHVTLRNQTRPYASVYLKRKVTPYVSLSVALC